MKNIVYKKIYYIKKDGQVVVTENGDDSALTVIKVIKEGNNKSKNKKAFVVSEGYIGAERSYNTNGVKKYSVSHKSNFGMNFLIEYIEKVEENIDNFYILFMSDKESMETQAVLFAEFIKRLGNSNIHSINMWCHSKSGLLALRMFEKLREEHTEEAEKTLKKIKAILTSMPVKGVYETDREDCIKGLEQNKILHILPFSGYIKTGILSFYDKFLYKACPAQVDIKRNKEKTEETDLIKLEPENIIIKLLYKINGNYLYNQRIKKKRYVEYDPEYLTKVIDNKNINSIKDINYKTLPVNLEKDVIFKSLIKQGQIMPIILYIKKIINKERRGDGINSFEQQGIEEKTLSNKLKVDFNQTINASHDLTITKNGGMEIIAQELLSK